MVSSKVIAFAAVLMIMCMGVALLHVEAQLTCLEASFFLRPCPNYLQTDGGLPPPPGCCSGLSRLITAAKMPPDGFKICHCLQALSIAIPGFNDSTALGLPDKCGIKLPNQFSPASIYCPE